MLAELEAVAVGIGDFGDADGNAAAGLVKRPQLAPGGLQLLDRCIEVVDLQVESGMGDGALGGVALGEEVEGEDEAVAVEGVPAGRT